MSSSPRGNTEQLTSSALNRMLMEFLAYFGRALVVFYPVYLTGYLGLSISWVLLFMMMVSWWRKNRQWKDARIGGAIDFVDNETQVIHKELSSTLNMASWVHFTEVEKVDWVNKVLEQAWPFFGMYMEKLLKENIQPVVRLSSPALKTFTFKKVHFGHIPLRITGMKVYTDEVDKREVILDLNFNYPESFQLHGNLRVILEPLIGQAPLVGGVTFFFIRRPTLQINWTGMTNLLDSPAFRLLSEDAIMDIIASLMVLPNRMCIPLIDQVKVDLMRFPLPRGVVRVHLLEARDLMAKDTYMMGMVKGKSDPYAVLRVGNRQFKSKTIKENLNPRWNEVYEFVVHEAPGQELEMELFDEDTDKDDLLGRFNLDFGEVKREKEMDQVTCICHKSLCGIIDFTHAQKHGKHPKEARLTRKTPNPNTFVEFSIDDQVQKSKVIYASKDPVWEEGFTFFVHDVENQQLRVQVKEHEKKTVLGVLTLPLSRLLNTSNMMLDQRFLLELSGANSQIKMKSTLRILNAEKPQPKIILDPSPQSTSLQTLQTNQGSDTSPATHSSSSPNTIPGQADYEPYRRSSLLASEGRRTPAATPHMRRFDSHSLLSENSIASSRFDVSEASPYPEAIMNHQGSFGEIQLTMRYAVLRNKLIVLVNSCRNLFPCSENGSDSYVRLYLLPDQSWRHRMRTHVKKRTVNPVFNEKFEFDVSLEEAGTRKLDVAVKNNKMFHTRERKEIGMVLINLSQVDLSKGITEWYELTLPGLKKSN
uniref:Extended synaptotagmin-like protein 3 n=1 Tax=Myripristis murdjan TaxID=586833 RepID=A0A667YN89_9TELE